MLFRRVWKAESEDAPISICMQKDMDTYFRYIASTHLNSALCAVWLWMKQYVESVYTGLARGTALVLAVLASILCILEISQRFDLSAVSATELEKERNFCLENIKHIWGHMS